MLAAPPASATQIEFGRTKVDGNGPKFDFDHPPPTRYHLTPTLTFGAKKEADFEYQRAFGLDRNNNEDMAKIRPEDTIAFSYDPADWLRAYAELSVKQTSLLEHPEGKDEDPANLDVDRAHVILC